mmetsp:Transcript_107671/g.343678  ORF Transcript_107671/g.343678 Transcript_107671/m.343678 type:complete len:151 (+) Transcript_107671:248-700(+)
MGVCSDEEDLDCGDSDFQELEAPQRCLIEALVCVTIALERVLQEASQACIPDKGVLAALATVGLLEAVALRATEASRAVQGLTTTALGDLEAAHFLAPLAELRAASEAMVGAGGGLGGAGSQAGTELLADLDELDAAFAAAAAAAPDASP